MGHSCFVLFCFVCLLSFLDLKDLSDPPVDFPWQVAKLHGLVWRFWTVPSFHGWCNMEDPYFLHDADAAPFSIPLSHDPAPICKSVHSSVPLCRESLSGRA